MVDFPQIRLYSSSSSSSQNTVKPAAPVDEVKIPKNLLEPFQTSHMQAENGAIVDKKPFKLHLEAGMLCPAVLSRTRSILSCLFGFSTGKQYSWCLCGKSKSQPICDGMHKNVHFKIKLR